LLEIVYEYTLGTAFDVSTSVFVDSFSVAAQDNGPVDVAFSTDGTKMFVVGDDGDAVYEYNIVLIGACSPPHSGDWTVSSTCTMTADATITNGDLIVQNNTVLTIPNGVTLNIDFTTHDLTVQLGSGISLGGTMT
jgi:DNA-binding beta-propeller fold protein YncE